MNHPQPPIAGAGTRAGRAFTRRRWDRASDFESTGLNSNCTGGIRSRGSMADDGRSNHTSARVCAPAVPQDFRGTDSGRYPIKLLILMCLWWAHKGSNLGPLPCEGRACISEMPILQGFPCFCRSEWADFGRENSLSVLTSVLSCYARNLERPLITFGQVRFSPKAT
jgi:hypothetical protein